MARPICEVPLTALTTNSASENTECITRTESVLDITDSSSRQQNYVSSIYARNREHLNRIVHSRRLDSEQQADERERAQKLQQQLARRVLGSSYERIATRLQLPVLTVSLDEHAMPASEATTTCIPASSDCAGTDSRASTSSSAAGVNSTSGSFSTGTLAQLSSPSSGSPGAQRHDCSHARKLLPPLTEEAPSTSGRSSKAASTSRSAMAQSPARTRGSAGTPGSKGSRAGADADSRGTSVTVAAGSGSKDEDDEVDDGGGKEDAYSPPMDPVSVAARAAQEQALWLMRTYGTNPVPALLAGFQQWKAKLKLAEDAKVFCMGGHGQHSSGIREALLERGWFQNPDNSSLYFDLKWASNPADINQEVLCPHQVVNHYPRASCITTKMGLCRNIQEMVWYEAADWHAFYPRGYVVDADGKDAFLRDARCTAAEGLIKRALLDGEVSTKAPTLVPLPLPPPPAKKATLSHATPASAAAETMLIACPASSDIPEVDARASVESSAGDATQVGQHDGTEGGPDSAGNVAASVMLGSRGSTGPAVDLPSLKLALRACMAALVHQQYLRSEHVQTCSSSCAEASSDATGAGRKLNAAQGDEQPPVDADLAESEWEQLLRHPALEAAAPPVEHPPLQPDWLERQFITAVHIPRSKRAGKQRKGSGGGAGGGKAAAAEGAEDAEGEEQAGSGVSDTEADALNTGKSIESTPVVMDITDLLSLGDGPPDLPGLALTAADITALDSKSWQAVAQSVLDALAAVNLQTHVNGTNNIWIVKPGGKSRGRGIRLFNCMHALMQYIQGDAAQGLESKWVAQKYVERPLIIQRRKFDIRQWVLVTDWNPLAAYFYKTCYLRFAADEYDPNNLDIFQHLTNNSIAKYFEGKVIDDDITSQGNMWTVARFKQWLKEAYGREDLWETIMYPAMRHIAICTLKCAQDMVTGRKSSCQLYGYDFLIDDQLRVWLLEINSSPTMEASTAITTDLCSRVQEDIVKVIVDLPAEAARRVAEGKGRLTPSTAAAVGVDIGCWDCILDGGDELKRPLNAGLGLELKGLGIKVPNRSVPTVPSCYSAHVRKAAAQQAAQGSASLGSSSASKSYSSGHLNSSSHGSKERSRASPMRNRSLSQAAPVSPVYKLVQQPAAALVTSHAQHISDGFVAEGSGALPLPMGISHAVRLSESMPAASSHLSQLQQLRVMYSPGSPHARPGSVAGSDSATTCGTGLPPPTAAHHDGTGVGLVSSPLVSLAPMAASVPYTSSSTLAAAAAALPASRRAVLSPAVCNPAALEARQGPGTTIYRPPALLPSAAGAAARAANALVDVSHSPHMQRPSSIDFSRALSSPRVGTKRVPGQAATARGLVPVGGVSGDYTSSSLKSLYSSQSAGGPLARSSSPPSVSHGSASCLQAAMPGNGLRKTVSLAPGELQSLASSVLSVASSGGLSAQGMAVGVSHESRLAALRASASHAGNAYASVGGMGVIGGMSGRTSMGSITDGESRPGRLWAPVKGRSGGLHLSVSLPITSRH